MISSIEAIKKNKAIYPFLSPNMSYERFYSPLDKIPGLGMNSFLDGNIHSVLEASFPMECDEN